MSSKQPSPTIMLAAAHLRILELEGDPIPHEIAKVMEPEWINSLFDYDHFPVAEYFDGPLAPWNLRPRLIGAHRIKTAKIDRPAIAKSKRIQEDQAEFRRLMLAKSGQGEPEHIGDVVDRVIAKAKLRRRYRWPKRAFPKRQNPWGKRQ